MCLFVNVNGLLDKWRTKERTDSELPEKESSVIPVLLPGQNNVGLHLICIMRVSK